MARLFTEGAEMGDLLTWNLIGEVTVSTSNPRSGLYKIITENGQAFTKVVTAGSEFYIRFGFNTNEDGASKLVSWYKGTTELGSIRRVAATDLLTLYTGTNTLVATGTISVPPYTWCLIEVHVKIADSGGVIELKINGSMDATGTFTGDTKPDTDTTIDKIYFSGAMQNWFDDIAINNTAGATDNSWCGDGHVIALVPNANGDSSQLAGSDGNSADNYLLVDEVPNDGDSTYVESSTPNEKDLYNLTASGLSNVNILRVWAEGRAKDTTTGAGTVKLVVKTESTEYDSDNIDLTTIYSQQIGTIHTVNPNTSAAWTPTQLDALQVGMKIVD